MQQPVDASADREVMAILSSPVQKFVVKPQPRAGGVAPGAGTLGPPSPRANGHHPPRMGPPGTGEYRNEGSGGGVMRGLGSDSSLSGTGSIGAGVVSSGSPPPNSALPRSGNASWDPHSQSSSSAFSVPAGRGVAGGRGDGAGSGVSVGNTGLGTRRLGGFRVVGAIPGKNGTHANLQQVSPKKSHTRKRSKDDVQ